MTATDDVEWRPVPGWPYECTIDGVVRHVRTKRHLTIRKGVVRKSGTYYLQVTLRLLETRMSTNLHRVVASAWIGPIGPGLVVNHIDANKLNNHASNLEICSQAENTRHARVNGLLPSGSRHWTKAKPESIAGRSRHGSAKLTEEKVAAIRASSLSSKELAKQFGVDVSSIYRIRRGELWRT